MPTTVFVRFDSPGEVPASPSRLHAALATVLAMHPLLLALDEAGNIAPIKRLPEIASAGGGQGALLESVWQDEGQIIARYGRDQVFAAFDAILDKTTQTFRREILSKIPAGTYVWEDYAEHDGVDEVRIVEPATEETR